MNGFIIPGSGPGTGLTTILAKEDTLYEHTHQYSTLDENGTEVGETWTNSDQEEDWILIIEFHFSLEILPDAALK